MIRKVLILIVLVFSFSNSKAQLGGQIFLHFTYGESLEKLKLAEELFNNGEYIICIDSCRSVLQNGTYQKQTEEQLLELLAKSQLELDRVTQADSTLKIIFKRNHFYQPDEAHNSEDYNRLVKRFNVHPLLTIGVKAALNFPHYKIMKTYSVLNDVDYSAKYNVYPVATSFWGFMEYEFKKRSAIDADLMVFFNSVYYRTLTKNDDPAWQLYYQENISLMEIPLYYKKYFQALRFKRSQYYAVLGLQYTRILSARYTLDYTFTNEDIFTGEKQQYVYHEKNQDAIATKNLNSYSWLAGGGVLFRLNFIGLSFDFRYIGGLTSITKPPARFQNPYLLNNYYYIDNKVKLNQWEVGASFYWTLKYSIKKSK